jgi:hypothetical protein
VIPFFADQIGKEDHLWIQSVTYQQKIMKIGRIWMKSGQNEPHFLLIKEAVYEWKHRSKV